MSSGNVGHCYHCDLLSLVSFLFYYFLGKKKNAMFATFIIDYRPGIIWFATNFFFFLSQGLCMVDSITGGPGRAVCKP